MSCKWISIHKARSHHCSKQNNTTATSTKCFKTD